MEKWVLSDNDLPRSPIKQENGVRIWIMVSGVTRGEEKVKERVEESGVPQSLELLSRLRLLPFEVTEGLACAGH